MPSNLLCVSSGIGSSMLINAVSSQRKNISYLLMKQKQCLDTESAIIKFSDFVGCIY